MRLLGIDVGGFRRSATMPTERPRGENLGVSFRQEQKKPPTLDEWGLCFFTIARQGLP